VTFGCCDNALSFAADLGAAGNIIETLDYYGDFKES